MAGRAYRAAPRSPSVAETLGWVLFTGNDGKRGDVKRAVALIEAAAKAAPDNAPIQYHPVSCNAAQGRKAEARKALETALTTRTSSRARRLGRRWTGSDPFSSVSHPLMQFRE